MGEKGRGGVSEEEVCRRSRKKSTQRMGVIKGYIAWHSLWCLRTISPCGLEPTFLRRIDISSSENLPLPCDGLNSICDSTTTLGDPVFERTDQQISPAMDQ